MKTIILSAGQGTRLLPLTESRPKCLLEVAEGVTILDWQLSQLASAGIDDVVVVTGYGADLVDQEIQKHRNLLNVRTLLNPGFDQMDNLGSAWHARDEMDQDFIILNGDTLFISPVVERLCAAKPVPVRTTISLTSSFDADDMKVALEGDQLKAISKQLDPAVANAESIGMILFRNEGVDQFRDAACEAMAEQRPCENRYYLSLIDSIARSHRVDICEAYHEEWSEVDFLPDLHAGRACLQRWQVGTESSQPISANCQPKAVSLQPAAGLL
jgi:choline kinase